MEQKVLFGSVEIVSCVFLLLLKVGDAISVQTVTFMFFDVNQGKEACLVQDYLAQPQGWKNILYIFCEL